MLNQNEYIQFTKHENSSLNFEGKDLVKIQDIVYNNEAQNIYNKVEKHKDRNHNMSAGISRNTLYFGSSQGDQNFIENGNRNYVQS